MLCLVHALPATRWFEDSVIGLSLMQTPVEGDSSRIVRCRSLIGAGASDFAIELPRPAQRDTVGRPGACSNENGEKSRTGRNFPPLRTNRLARRDVLMAGSTGLEPATSGLTVQCANQAAPRARIGTPRGYTTPLVSASMPPRVESLAPQPNLAPYAPHVHLVLEPLDGWATEIPVHAVDGGGAHHGQELAFEKAANGMRRVRSEEHTSE